MDWIKNTILSIKDPLIAAIRTGTATAVSWFIAWTIGLGVTVPDGFEVPLNATLFGLAAVLYNLVVSFLERKVHPLFGLLVIIPRAPAYATITMKSAAIINEDAARVSGLSPPDVHMK